jgi:hypothetical protein
MWSPAAGIGRRLRCAGNVGRCFADRAPWARSPNMAHTAPRRPTQSAHVVARAAAGHSACGRTSVTAKC